MAKVFTTTIDKFNGGIVNDPRDPREAVSVGGSNVDITTNPYQFAPRYASESGDDAPTTSKKQNFTTAIRTGSTYSLYALGVQSGATDAEVLYKDLTTGASNDLDDTTWAATANNQGTGTATAFDLFVYYEPDSEIYGARDGSHIWRYDPTGSGSFESSFKALSYTTVRQGLVHSKDDVLYIPVDNTIYAKDGADPATLDLGLTLPSNLRVECIAEFGDYLAIGCVPKSGQPLFSIVYLWDRDSSLETISESYDFGNQGIKWLMDLNGTLIGGGMKGGKDNDGNTIATSITSYVTLKALTAGGFKEIVRMEADDNNTIFPNMVRKANGRIYFQMYGTFSGSSRETLWSLGSNLGQFTLAQEFTPNNVTALTSGTPEGFFILGDFVFQSYTSSSAYALSKTVATGTYTQGNYETTINPQMPTEHRSAKKQLVGIRVNFESLPASATVAVDYDVDGAGFVESVVENTDGTFFSESKFDTNKALFTAGTDYSFRIRSVGGAVITGLTYQYELIDTQV